MTLAIAYLWPLVHGTQGTHIDVSTSLPFSLKPLVPWYLRKKVLVPEREKGIAKFEEKNKITNLDFFLICTSLYSEFHPI